MSDLQEARGQAERSIGALQDALTAEIGWAPRRSYLLLPLLGVAVGFTVARWLREARTPPSSSS